MKRFQVETMPLDIVTAVRDRFLADGQLSAMLAEYENAPAILTGGVLPEDLSEMLNDQPVMLVDEPFYDEDASTFNTVLRDVKLRVRFFTKSNGSNVNMLNATERAKAVFRNISQPAFSTGKLEASFVSGPQNAPTEDPSIEGRLLTLSLMIKE